MNIDVQQCVLITTSSWSERQFLRFQFLNLNSVT